jgi:hypothetical protein
MADSLGSAQDSGYGEEREAGRYNPGWQCEDRTASLAGRTKNNLRIFYYGPPSGSPGWKADGELTGPECYTE